MDRNISFPLTTGRRTFGFRDERSLRDAVFGSKDFVQRMKLDTTLDVHRGCVNTISWNERGSLILSGSDDKKLCFTDPFSKKVEATIPSGHRSNIFSAKFLPFAGDRQVVSCSGDGCIMFSDLDNPDMYGRNSFNCHYGTAYEVVTLPSDPNTFMSCGEDGTVRWFDLRIKTNCAKEECKEDVLINCRRAVTGICVNPIMPYQLAIGCSDSSVRIFDRRMLGTKLSGNHVGRGMQGVLCRFCPSLLQNKYSRPTSLAYSANGQDLLVSYSSDYIYLFGTNARYKENDEEEACAAAADPTNDEQEIGDDDDDDKDEFTAGNPVKRLRLRGDWSDTGPRARPRSEQPEGERPRSTMVQRMSEMLSRWLEESSSSPRRPAHANRPGVVGSSFSTPASTAASSSGATAAASPATSAPSATRPTSGASRSPATASPSSEATSTTSTASSLDPATSPAASTSSTTSGTQSVSETSLANPAISPSVATSVATSASSTTSITHGTLEGTSVTSTTSTTQSASTTSPKVPTSTATTLATSLTVAATPSTSSAQPATTEAARSCPEQGMSVEDHEDSVLPGSVQMFRIEDSLDETDRVVAQTDSTEGKVSEGVTVGASHGETRDEGNSESAMEDGAILEEQRKEMDRRADFLENKQIAEPTGDVDLAGSDSKIDPAKVKGEPRKRSEGQAMDLGQSEQKDATRDSHLEQQSEDNLGQRVETETSEIEDEETRSQVAARTVPTAEPLRRLQDGRKDNEDNEKKGIFALGDRQEDTNPVPRLTKQDSVELSRSRKKSIVGDPPDVQSLSDASPSNSTPSSSTQATRRKDRGKEGEDGDEKEDGEKEDGRRKREEERKERSSTSSMQSLESESSQSSSQSMTCSESESDEALDVLGPEREKKTPHQMDAPHQPRERVRSEAEMRLRALFKTRKEEREREAEIIKNVYSPSVERIYRGHRNSRTMIKEANFWGDHYIVSGSDCGHIFIWDRYTAQLVMLLEGDKHVVNCIQPHPVDPILATSGIDYNVKLWAPLAPEPYFPENATEVMRINELMLEETRDTITVPPSFMLRMLASLNHIRGERGRSTDRQSASESSDD